MGKSTLVRLLVALWRSQGLRVIVLGSSAKAARLVGGHTVHSACLLDSSGSFEVPRLQGTQGDDRFVWLATADIVRCVLHPILWCRKASGLGKYVLSSPVKLPAKRARGVSSPSDGHTSPRSRRLLHP